MYIKKFASIVAILVVILSLLPINNTVHAQIDQFVIGIQAGHWKDPVHTGGTSTCDGTKEVDINLQVANKVVALLKTYGYSQSIVLSAEGGISNWKIDGYSSDYFDIFVSLHLDNVASCSSNPPLSTDPAGYKVAGPSSYLVETLWSEYEKTTGFTRDPGHITINMTGYYAFNYLSANTKKAIIEMGWLSNQDELSFVKSEDGQNKMAEAIAKAIIRSIPIDVFMLVDLSGSFDDDLPIFKSQAHQIISSLKASNPDIRFGLGSFEDYPIYPFGDAASGDVAYRRNIDLTSDTTAVEATINNLFIRWGYDLPQSQLPALYQAATGAGQDLSGAGYPGASIPSGQQANFRDGAKKIFLLWTDASFHYPGDSGAIPYPGPSFEDTVNAIKALDPPMVIGISSGGGGYSDLAAIASATGALAPAGGVDCDGNGSIDILEGEPLVCSIAYSGEGIGDAIVALVGAAGEVTNLPPSLTVPGNQNVHYGAPLSFDVTATDPDNAVETLAFAATGLPNDIILTNNGDGTATISGIVNAAPGIYTAEITVTDPGGLSDTKPVTIEVVYSVPNLPVLDNFNRANGAIGANWLGNKTQYRVSNNQLLLNYYGTKTDIFWKTAFGADQEAYVTFSKISPTTKEQSLLLKAQSNRTWGNGVIEVQYSPKTKSVQVWTYEWPKGWVKYGDDIPVTFVNGDVFGARARADGIVEIYRNGELLGTRDITAWSYYAKGGYIGLWIQDAKATILDDFGGGTVPAFP